MTLYNPYHLPIRLCVPCIIEDAPINKMGAQNYKHVAVFSRLVALELLKEFSDSTF